MRNSPFWKFPEMAEAENGNFPFRESPGFLISRNLFLYRKIPGNSFVWLTCGPMVSVTMLWTGTMVCAPWEQSTVSRVHGLGCWLDGWVMCWCGPDAEVVAYDWSTRDVRAEVDGWPLVEALLRGETSLADSPSTIGCVESTMLLRMG